jgi:hypothetical protein
MEENAGRELIAQLDPERAAADGDQEGCAEGAGGAAIVSALNTRVMQELQKPLKLLVQMNIQPARVKGTDELRTGEIVNDTPAVMRLPSTLMPNCSISNDAISATGTGRLGVHFGYVRRTGTIAGAGQLPSRPPKRLVPSARVQSIVTTLTRAGVRDQGHRGAKRDD